MPRPAAAAAVPSLRNYTTAGNVSFMYVPTRLTYEEADATCWGYAAQLAWFESAALYDSVMAELAPGLDGVRGIGPGARAGGRTAAAGTVCGGGGTHTHRHGRIEAHAAPGS